MTWPVYAEVLAPGFRLGADEDAERTPFEDGMVRQEKRWTSALRTAQVVALVDADRLPDFRAWAAREAHLWFDFPTPLAKETVDF